MEFILSLGRNKPTSWAGLMSCMIHDDKNINLMADVLEDTRNRNICVQIYQVLFITWFSGISLLESYDLFLMPYTSMTLK
jgi:hypothetical protein